jgi:DNA-binding CsgD family transcriptional regulator
MNGEQAILTAFNEINKLVNHDEINRLESFFDSSLQNDLTQRQLDCLYGLVQGMTMKEIALLHRLSPKTVEHYLDRIKFKLQCKSRSELISKALKLSYIKNKLSL